MHPEPIAILAFLLYFAAEAYKNMLAKVDVGDEKKAERKATIPYTLAIVGAFFTICLTFYRPSILGTTNLLEATLAGLVAGLVATGSHQVIHQFTKLKQDAESVQNEINDAMNTIKSTTNKSESNSQNVDEDDE